MELFIGAVVSLAVQYFKNKLGTGEYGTLLLALVAAFVGAAGYVLLVHTDFWPTIVAVLTTSGAFYTFIIQRFTK